MELRRQSAIEPVVAANQPDLVEFLDDRHPRLVFWRGRQREPDPWRPADAPRSGEPGTIRGCESDRAANTREGRRVLHDAKGRRLAALFVWGSGRAAEPSVADVDFPDGGTRSREQAVRDHSGRRSCRDVRPTLYLCARRPLDLFRTIPPELHVQA